MEVGLRVVRGPDWKYGDQDGGEGHVGTVVELGEDSTSIPDDCVVVLWDSGTRKTYMAGHEGAFDLLVLNNGICGVKHENISCDGCQEREIEGVRWKCGVCPNFDLCTTCYMDDKHDVTHTFLRFYAPSAERVAVGKRADVREKKTAMGIFVGATVCRGCDWRWGDQDGGAGTEGLVVGIGDWGEGSYGSKASVLWPSLSINNYRLGHDGDVDLRCIKPSKGGSYYKEHLSVLGTMKGRLKKRDGSDLAAALALGLLGESLLSRPLQRMLVMHQVLEAFKEMVTGSPEDTHVGTRVVRGPDWKWMNQDGGVGHVGTVVKATPEQTVTVVWDRGEGYVYRIGKDNLFDLLIYDNAPCGVVHSTVKCADCNTDGIRGIRWKCSDCQNYDLCHVCYMTDKHTRYHKFYRIDRPDDKMVLVPPRSEGGCERIQSRGIFKGATVSRGRDWNYGDQDGSAGKEGKVVEIRNWENESGRSEARVSWSFFSRTCSYRVGHEGQVDLKYVTPGMGLVYYKNHLPVLGKSEKPSARFKIGDQVKCEIEAEILKMFQVKHGGWNQEMAKYINKQGTVCDVDKDGDVHVVYEDRKKWCFNPEALVKIEPKRLTLAEMMKDDIVKQVIELDIPEDLIKKTLTKRLAETGMQFESAEALTQAILQDHCGGAVASGAQSDSIPGAGAKPQADSNLDKENQFLRQQRQCKICMDSEAVITFVPCGHLTCCGTCAAAVDNCPICRSPIERRIRTFVS